MAEKESYWNLDRLKLNSLLSRSSSKILNGGYGNTTLSLTLSNPTLAPHVSILTRQARVLLPCRFAETEPLTNSTWCWLSATLKHCCTVVLDSERVEYHTSRHCSNGVLISRLSKISSTCSLLIWWYVLIVQMIMFMSVWASSVTFILNKNSSRNEHLGSKGTTWSPFLFYFYFYF